MTDYRSRIALEPGQRGGKACIRGLRITVQDVLDWLAAGMSEADILIDYPELDADDVRVAAPAIADREAAFADPSVAMVELVPQRG